MHATGYLISLLVVSPQNPRTRDRMAGSISAAILSSIYMKEVDRQTGKVPLQRKKFFISKLF